MATTLYLRHGIAVKSATSVNYVPLYLRVSCGVLRLGNSRPGVDRLLRRSCLDGVEVPTMAESGIAVTKGVGSRGHTAEGERVLTPR